jgi:ribosomal protein L7/L12
LGRFLSKNVPNCPDSGWKVVRAIDIVSMGGTLTLTGLQEDEARSLRAGLVELGAWVGEPATFRLLSVGPLDLRVMKLIRKHVGVTWIEARDAVKAVKEGRQAELPARPRDQAEHLRDELELVGATAEVEDLACQSPTARQTSPVRQPVPERVRHEVWRRDQGRCVDCGSRERLEFDHIIPISKGGSNTARNIELRCEPCNRRKAARI